MGSLAASLAASALLQPSPAPRVLPWPAATPSAPASAAVSCRVPSSPLALSSMSATPSVSPLASEPSAGPGWLKCLWMGAGLPCRASRNSPRFGRLLGAGCGTARSLQGIGGESGTPCACLAPSTCRQPGQYGSCYAAACAACHQTQEVELGRDACALRHHTTLMESHAPASTECCLHVCKPISQVGWSTETTLYVHCTDAPHEPGATCGGMAGCPPDAASSSSLSSWCFGWAALPGQHWREASLLLP